MIDRLCVERVFFFNVIIVIMLCLKDLKFLNDCEVGSLLSVFYRGEGCLIVLKDFFCIFFEYY